MNEFFSKDYVYTIVGASADQDKYGHRIFRTLLEADYKVYGVNPKGEEILGQKVFKTLLEVIPKPEIVDFVTPPEITRKVLDEVKRLGIEKVWFQPGSYNDECLKFCDDNSIRYVKDFCLMKSVLNK